MPEMSGSTPGKTGNPPARDGEKPPPPGRFTLPRSRRLRLDRDFRRVFARRCRAADSHLLVYVDYNDLDYSRLAVVAPRRLGNAVARNRIKRLIREAFRLGRGELPAGLDIICVPKPTDSPSLSAYQSSLPRLVERAARRLATTTPRK